VGVFFLQDEKRLTKLRPHRKQENKGGEKASRECPSCHSNRFWKDGIRKTKNGSVQRCVCRDCGYRFSESSVLSMNLNYGSKRRVCAVLMEAKNLTEVEPQKSGLAGATKPTEAIVKGKIVEFEWYLMRNGYKPSTIKRYTRELELLAKRGANILEPESIKETVAKQSWKDSRKLGVCHVYNTFLNVIGKIWVMPKYKPVHMHPFVPTESTLNQIIAGTGKKMSTYFQLLTETGVRSGEADKLRWIDVDQERCIVRVIPEKNSKPRTLRVSKDLIGRLMLLPKTSERVFGDVGYNAKRTGWARTRKSLAKKLNNPQIAQVTFHTFRRWYATNLYHETKNILFVQRRLGHKNIASTLLYVEIEEELYGNSPDGKFICEIAETSEKAKKLIEKGFDYLGEIHGEPMFRKRE
jgi:integrase